MRRAFVWGGCFSCRLWAAPIAARCAYFLQPSVRNCAAASARHISSLLPTRGLRLMKEGVVMFAGYATSMIKWPHHRRPQLSHLHGSLRRGVSAALESQLSMLKTCLRHDSTHLGWGWGGDLSRAIGLANGMSEWVGELDDDYPRSRREPLCNSRCSSSS